MRSSLFLVSDFVRTYTWDKRVESFVKETTLLGGGGKGLTPTIITPVQYRGRFLAFLDRIFLMVSYTNEIIELALDHPL